jgi:hypothetical protein
LQANPAKLVARVKRLEEEAAALKEMCRDLLTQKQVSSSPLCFHQSAPYLLPMLTTVLFFLFKNEFN